MSDPVTLTGNANQPDGADRLSDPVTLTGNSDKLEPEGADQQSRLRGLEAAIKEMAPFLPREVERPCADCGVDSWMHPRARYCEECRECRRAEANRAAQRRRRRRETGNRHEAAGMVQRTRYFRVPVPVACVRCGEKFSPRRTTARYCSTRCRVAAHREKQRK